VIFPVLRRIGNKWKGSKEHINGKWFIPCISIEAKGPLLGIKHLWYTSINKQLLDEVCDIRNNQGWGRRYQQKSKACYSNSNNCLVTESNNCFIIHWTKQKKSCVCFFTDGNKTKRVNLTWLPLEMMHRGHTWHNYPWPWHDYCIICSYDVTGADFENSLYAFGQSEKDIMSSMYNNTK